MNPYADRKYIIIILILISAFLFIVKLFLMQVVDDQYKLSAESNSRRDVIIYPARGLVYDRNGAILVSNQAAYDIMVVPRQMVSMDTAEFCEVLGIEKQDFIERINKAKDYSYYAPSVFMKQVSAEISSVFSEKLFLYQGFYLQSRTLRKYPKNIASHVLGYVGEVNKSIVENSDYYVSGDYIGISGIEKTYEDILRGEKGHKYFLVDVHNRITGQWESGKYDEQALLGTDIILTIDNELQEYGEKLMSAFSGSIVAIEPQTGEILSLVSAPSYPPDLLVGRGLSENFKKLAGDTLNPVFNRAVAASYPPGSTFKIINGLIALEEKVLTPYSEYSCNMGYYYRGIHVGCHSHDSPLDFEGAVQNSCNAYFCNVLRNILEDKKFQRTDSAFSNWKTHVESFGFGNRLGTDVSGELKGFVPSTSYYNRYYGSGHWNFLTVLSLSIGQGELGITPLQMANMSATLANRGHYFVPHLIKAFGNDKKIDPKYKEKHSTTIDSTLFELAVNGMDLVVNGAKGSTARIAKMNDIVICGKTGTAENPFGEDHSIFIAFAPKDDPQIAIAVYVENVGFGASWAAPIASLMIEKYLTKELTRSWLESYILNGPQKIKKEEE
ncbi:MAG: penicillin-binding protein 2 [Bacteroidales bacterium]|nr:penicillin-binding protein 2 [Bacteroidales bacterium]MCF8389378.1 penicillin-binding protein 2 [Bacteroidales bacterium]